MKLLDREREIAEKFVNYLVKAGRKATAERLFVGTLAEIARRRQFRSPWRVFFEAVENVKPMVEVRTKQVAGRPCQVPMQVSAKRKEMLAFRWLIEAAQEARGHPFYYRLANEILLAYERDGKAMSRRENTIRMSSSDSK